MSFKFHKETLLQDLSLLVFLISVFLCMLVVSFDGTQYLRENLIMMLVTIVAIILVTFASDFAAFIVVGSQLICYTAYKIFTFYSFDNNINLPSYAWFILPALAVFSMRYFCLWRNRLEIENSMLREQVEQLVVVDPLTQLYNLRSLYHDFPQRVGFAKRNNLAISLMIIKLRYGEELVHILSTKEFDNLKIELSKIAQDTIRIEDDIYSIDDDGSLASILTCDKAGAEIVAKRLRANVAKDDAFNNIINGHVKVEVKIGFKQYDSETYRDFGLFKSQVEDELQYDV